MTADDPEVATPDAPEVVTPDDSYFKVAVNTSREKQYYGMSKRVFLLAIVLGIILVVGVVGGVVGVIKPEKSKTATVDNSRAGSSSSTSTSTHASSVETEATVSTPTSPTAAGTSSTAASTNPTSLATTLDTSKSVGSIAASMFHGDQVYIHLYYQQGSNIGYRVYNGIGNFKTAQSLDFTTAPKAGTPLTAIESSSAGQSYVSKFLMPECIPMRC